MKKTNQPKETMQSLQKEIKETNRQVAITRNDLTLSIDRMFYDCENLEDQSRIFRTILNQFSNYDLTSIKQYVKLSTEGK
jgi:hypothetical protein|tara:strand:+ start:317 stop:556 length:240 start_codon:yes stop_codon:yes gene_type:complete